MANMTSYVTSGHIQDHRAVKWGSSADPGICLVATGWFPNYQEVVVDHLESISGDECEELSVIAINFPDTFQTLRHPIHHIRMSAPRPQMLGLYVVRHKAAVVVLPEIETPNDLHMAFKAAKIGCRVIVGMMADSVRECLIRISAMGLSTWEYENDLLLRIDVIDRGMPLVSSRESLIL